MELSRPTILFLLLWTACGVLIGQQQAAKPKVPQTMRFRRVSEPKENAFSVVAAALKKNTGGIIRGNPAIKGPVNALGAKTDFAVMRDAQGTAMIRLLPDYMFTDVTGTRLGTPACSGPAAITTAPRSIR